ncbi:MAG: glycine betaine/proline transport system substrate-binding protein [Clostridia bacterium]|nr:glycine betaine/proline transport system substrate-binding protein [Clostridia bacterium]
MLQGNSRKLIIVFSLLLLLLVGVVGCSEKETSKKKVKIGYVNWAENIANTGVAEAIIEDKLGYEVEATQADVGPVFMAVAEGDYDAFLDVWLPVTHKSYMDEIGAKVDNYGKFYEGARIGLVVPDYVTIKSIDEMKANKAKFDGRIIGIDAGAGIMKTTAKAIKEYGLDFKLIEGSEAAMIAELADAIKKNEWIAVTGWTPHWKFARWKLKFLEDPKGIYGKAEDIYIIARKGLDKDMPDVAKFLKNFKMNDTQLGELESMINDGMEPVEAGRKWMQEHEDVVKSWLK